MVADDRLPGDKTRLSVDTGKFSPQTSYGSSTLCGSCAVSSPAEGSWNAHRRIVALSCVVCLAVVAEGYDISVLNGAIVLIQNDLGISTWEVSLVVAMTPLFVIPGSLIGGSLGDRHGRRFALIVTCALLSVGPLFMALAPSFAYLLAARCLVGIAIGMGIVTVSAYLGEISGANMRGRVIVLQEVFLNFGMLAGYIASYLLLGVKHDWRWMLAFGSVLPCCLLFGLMCPQVPESPRWLYMHGREKDAHEVLLAFLNKAEADAAMKAMELECERSPKREFATWMELLAEVKKGGPTRRIFLAGVCVTCSQMICGYLAVAYYSSLILKESMSEKSAFLGTVAMGLAKFLVVLFVVAVIERFGRRSMMLSSMAVMSFACAWLACSFWLTWGGMAKVAGLMAYMAGYSLGLGPICYVYVTEIFRTELRAKGLAISIFLSRIVGVMSVLLFPLFTNYLGSHIAFSVQAVVNVFAFCILWMLTLETHGLPLEDVEKLFC